VKIRANLGQNMSREREAASHSQSSSPGLCAIAHMDWAIQYAADHRFNHCRLWNTGSPACAGDDTVLRGLT
jgi:hypothetical protein